MKNIFGIAIAILAFALFVIPADAARNKTVAVTVVKQRGNKQVTKTVVKNKGVAKTAVVNVNVNAGHAKAATVVKVNNAHLNTFVAHSHAGFAVAHHNTFAVANHGYNYGYNNFAIVQPVKFTVAAPQYVATVPVDIVNAPAVVTETKTTYQAAPTTCQTATYGYGVNTTQGYIGRQKIVKTQAIQTVNVPVAVGVHGY